MGKGNRAFTRSLNCIPGVRLREPSLHLSIHETAVNVRRSHCEPEGEDIRLTFSIAVLEPAFFEEHRNDLSSVRCLSVTPDQHSMHDNYCS